MKEKEFLIFSAFKTQRLVIRQLKEGDAAAISSLHSDAAVNKYLERNKQQSIEEALEFICRINKAIQNKQSLYWAVNLKGDPELIGTICLWNFSEDKTTGELGYELNPSFQRKGIMNEAIQPVINYGFNKIGLKKIEAYVHKNNTASKRLLEKNNFRLQVNRKDASNPKNIIYVLTRSN